MRLDAVSCTCTNARTHADPVVPLNWLFPPAEQGERGRQERAEEKRLYERIDAESTTAKRIRSIEIRLGPLSASEGNVIPLAAVRRRLIPRHNDRSSTKRCRRKVALRRKSEFQRARTNDACDLHMSRAAIDYTTETFIARALLLKTVQRALFFQDE